MALFDRWLAVCFSALLLVLSSSSASAWSLDSMPEDLEQVDIYLHTLDVGNLIYNNFGHTAIRVHDRLSGKDLVFNWGIFDFGEPIGFALEFYKGILNYKLGVYPYSMVYNGYKYEDRTIWEDKLLLDHDQKYVLLRRLIWNNREENRSYAYQYFFDNCSTRPRDYLDEAFQRKLQWQTQHTLTPESFREMMYSGYQYNPGMDVFLDIVMNSRLDRNMTVWEKMFHPLDLRQVLLRTAIDGHPILEEGTVLFSSPSPKSYRGHGYLWTLLLVGIPLVLSAIMLFLPHMRVDFGPWIYRFWAFFTTPLLALGALLGFLMPLTWLVSAHLDLHHNANMWLFWPLDFWLLICTLLILKRGAPISLSSRLWKWNQVYLISHLLLTMLLPILRILGLIHQDVNRVLVYILPIYLGILFLLYRFGFLRKSVD